MRKKLSASPLPRLTGKTLSSCRLSNSPKATRQELWSCRRR